MNWSSNPSPGAGVSLICGGRCVDDGDKRKWRAGTGCWSRVALTPRLSPPQGEGVQQLREALKILAERVLILEHMIGIHGEW